MPSARAVNSLTVTLRRIDLDRGERPVLRDVSWRITPGQRWLLIGANGAGKTQLLKLLAGAMPVQQGLREPGHIVDALKRSLDWYARLVKPARGTTSAR